MVTPFLTYIHQQNIDYDHFNPKRPNELGYNIKIKKKKTHHSQKKKNKDYERTIVPFSILFVNSFSCKAKYLNLGKYSYCLLHLIYLQEFSLGNLIVTVYLEDYSLIKGTVCKCYFQEENIYSFTHLIKPSVYLTNIPFPANKKAL